MGQALIAKQRLEHLVRLPEPTNRWELGDIRRAKQDCWQQLLQHSNLSYEVASEYWRMLALACEAP